MAALKLALISAEYQFTPELLAGVVALWSGSVVGGAGLAC